MYLDPLYPGDRVLVFDHRLYKNDRQTPLTTTMRPATVIRYYGKYCKGLQCFYPDLIDVVFDHRPQQESKGHFLTSIEPL